MIWILSQNDDPHVLDGGVPGPGPDILCYWEDGVLGPLRHHKVVQLLEVGLLEFFLECL